MFYTVDKIENKLVELHGDDSSVIVLPMLSLGFKVRENDVVSFDDVSCTFISEKDETSKRTDSLKARTHSLFGRKKS